MPAFVARYANAFAEVVTDAKLDTAAIDRQFCEGGSLRIANMILFLKACSDILNSSRLWRS